MHLSAGRSIARLQANPLAPLVGFVARWLDEAGSDPNREAEPFLLLAFRRTVPFTFFLP